MRHETVISVCDLDHPVSEEDVPGEEFVLLFSDGTLRILDICRAHQDQTAVSDLKYLLAERGRIFSGTPNGRGKIATQAVHDRSVRDRRPAGRHEPGGLYEQFANGDGEKRWRCLVADETTMFEPCHRELETDIGLKRHQNQAHGLTVVM